MRHILLGQTVACMCESLGAVCLLGPVLAVNYSQVLVEFAC